MIVLIVNLTDSRLTWEIDNWDYWDICMRLYMVMLIDYANFDGKTHLNCEFCGVGVPG